MPNTIAYSFGDVVLVPFPFTDQTASKKRPAVVVSGDAYHQRRPDVIVTFVDRYNRERPHQALQMRVPADVYTPSPRPYRGLGDLDYPLHDWATTVTNCGRICFKNRKVNLSQVFAGQQVGVRQVDEHIWLVTFMHYDLGYFDDETCRLEPIENPFGPTVLPMSPE
jgi:putative transposase